MSEQSDRRDLGPEDKELVELETGIKKKRKSRWVQGSGVPRYDKKTLDMIGDTYVETPPFRHGAKVVKQNG